VGLSLADHRSTEVLGGLLPIGPLDAALRVSTLIGLAALVAAFLFLVSRQILRLNIFRKLTSDATLDLLKHMINRLFLLALLAMVLAFLGPLVRWAVTNQPPGLPSFETTPSKIDSVVVGTALRGDSTGVRDQGVKEEELERRREELMVTRRAANEAAVRVSAAAERLRLAQESRAQRLLAQGVVIRGDLIWTRRDNGQDVNQFEARSYCETCRLGGFEDWRMPTIEELRGLYDPGNVVQVKNIAFDAYIASPFEVSFPCCISSTMHGSSALYFCFNNGQEGWGPPMERSGGRVRCVRSDAR